MMREWFGLFLFVLMNVASASAAPLTPEDVPDPLRPWVKWVLQDHKDYECPFLYNDNEQKQCSWPSRLELKLDARGGSFSQQWLVVGEEWIAVPGDVEHWPQDVQLNGQPALVTDREGVPSLWVKTGNYTVTGTFAWDSLPQALQVPQEVGLVALTVENRVIDFPQLDDSGKVWLQQGVVEQEQVEDRLELKVYRRLTDEIPVMVTVRVDIQVAGKQREVLLGPAITSEYIPMSLNSPLPARLEPDGQLRVQVRAGTWTLILIARHTGTRVSVVPLPAVSGESWPQEEIWVFEARPHLRQVEIEGVPAIDPQQTTLPDDWRSFPTYRLQAGESLKLVREKRGDPEPDPDQLTLTRSWWLDFDGRGYTIQDQVGGVMTSGWRLDLSPPGVLGRVAVDGQEQFITKSDQSGRAGVELRRGNVSLVADSRLDGNVRSVSAVGWEQDFKQVSGQLHLPPGWRVLHASGVDYMPGTWVARWTLWDLFTVFLMAVAVSKLWGWVWGVVALAALTLIAQESGAPWWIWLQVLAAVSLQRVLPEGWPRRVASAYRVVVLLSLLLISASFMLQQARLGLYPQLERPSQVMQDAVPPPPAAPAPVPEAQDAMVRRQMAADERLVTEEDKAAEVRQNEAGKSQDASTSEYGSLGGRGGMLSDVLSSKPYSKRKLEQYDPSAAVQTGPGLPRWRWNTLELTWTGSVNRTQEVRFTLLSPNVNRVLAFARILLLAVLLFCVLEIRARDGKRDVQFWPGATGTTAGLLLLLLLIPGWSFAQTSFPSPEMLTELRERLLRKDAPECLPNCATSPRLRLEVAGDTLRIRQEIHAAARVAIPLPGSARHWLPRTILLDGQPAEGLQRTEAGQVLIDLPIGQHQLLLEGPLPKREAVELALPLKPYVVQVQADGWEVEGVHEDGVADEQIQLRRIRDDTEQAEAATLEPGTLPPFVRVERTVHLGLTWSVDSRVLRVSPRGTAAVVEVSLLDGESVTTAGVRVENRKVLVNMAPNDTEVTWTSVLAISEKLNLSAPQTTAWSEIWRLDVSPIWRVQPSGIPVVHHSDLSSGFWFPEWHPWPGETVALQISRPEGLSGQTLTIDSSVLEVTPGLRMIDATLRLELRSSRGGQHAVTLPDNASLQSVTINNQSRAIRQEGRTVTLPLTPGLQWAELRWQQTADIATRFETPVVNLGVPSVNTQIFLTVPQDRWVLFCGGPPVGPAVLFWSVFSVIVLGAIVLGRTSITPLRTHHWILLGIGLSPISVESALVVVLWLFALAWRKRFDVDTGSGVFNLTQVGLVFVTVFAITALFFAVQSGLMGSPDMRVAGNGSHSLLLRWYQDRTGPELPHGWMFSLPLFVYRLTMLAWALWLAFALIRWLRWGWECFSTNGLWRKIEPIIRPAPVAGPPTPPVVTNEDRGQDG
ncbi:MAG: hypothetical protein HOP18_20700 [Deltaproteobacteria bacterium]|nr:hypothetical protein [Deltaproteobacteria bacterium]